ncbi:MAG: putative alanine racemase [Verrucomicrobiota bacterium]|jgi:alanine racemase
MGTDPEPNTSPPPIPDLPTGPSHLPRPAWIEINLSRLHTNLQIIRQHLPENVQWLAVVKDDAYGHGLLRMARACLNAGASFLGVSTLSEGAELRNAGIDAPILLLGERHPDELPFCLEYRLRVSLGDLTLAPLLNNLTTRAGLVTPIHLKINTGMGRFGVHWNEAGEAATLLKRLPGLLLEGTMSHFSMSDEADKSFAHEQIAHFKSALAAIQATQTKPGLRHLCNTGGFLDLPQARFDMVRLGVLPTGVYPSLTCQRLPGLQPVMSLKARIIATRTLQPGDVYGYGLRYRAPSQRHIGILPLGYGDGYPRLRNTGHVLIRGQPAPIIGGVSMDAIGIDLTDIPGAATGDEAVLMGEQGPATISARDIAAWGKTVCYDSLTSWRHRLPRIETHSTTSKP